MDSQRAVGINGTAVTTLNEDQTATWRGRNIARALANDPPILVADEPTGNLDSRTADDVLTLFQNLAGDGKTVIMVTHERDVASWVSRVVVLVDGRIVTKKQGSGDAGERPPIVNERFFAQATANSV